MSCLMPWQILGMYSENCDCINLIDTEQLQLYNSRVRLHNY